MTFVVDDVTSTTLSISSAFNFQVVVSSVIIYSMNSIISNNFVSLVFDFFIAFEKSFAIFFVSNIVMSNDVTIHQFSNANNLIVIMKKFFVLWTNADFVELSKKNWMRIFLKSNWENRVFEKTKIYLLKARDRELMNQIFDELHE